MSIELYALTCGWLTMRMSLMLDGTKGEMQVPVPVYVIRHARHGIALFDSGLHRQCQTDPAARLEHIAKYHKVHFKPGEDVAAQLERLDIDAADVKILINSHLHFDHAGGNEHIANATQILQRREWEAAHDADLIAANGYLQKDYDHGHDLRLLDGEEDLFGDGTAVAIPTYGHTPGHQSLKLRTATGNVVLAGDACYLRRTLEDLHLPRIMHDRDQMLQSLHRLKALQRAGARIFYGHDPEFWTTVPKAPKQIL